MGDGTEKKFMNTEYIAAPEYISGDDVQKAVRVWSSGGLVAFPTETVYGLGANAFDQQAVAKLFAVKGRPADNPLILHLALPSQLIDVAEVPEIACHLIECGLIPGPLTLVLKKNESIPRIVTGGLDTVAVRFPANEVARKLLSACGFPVAAPSANLSGRPSPTTAAHVRNDLDGRIEMIIDGGSCEIGIESTVLDLTRELPVILRPGFVTREELETACGCRVLEAPALAPAVAPASPGMKYKHYAPRGEVVLVNGSDEALAAYLRAKEKGSAVMLLKASTAEKLLPQANGDIFILGEDEDMAGIAKNLYAMLRLADERDAKIVIIDSVSETGAGTAIMNRIKKAAGTEKMVL